MSTATRLLSADEFDRLPEPEEGGKMELVDGEVVIEMPVNGEHGELQLEVGGQLRAFASRHGLGKVFVETGFRLVDGPVRPHIVRAPDVSFVARDRLPAREQLRRGTLHLAPDLAVEVVSPDDLDSDVQRKVGDYLRAGTPRVWVIRPGERTVTVHRPDGSAQTHGSGGVLDSDDAGFTVAGFSLALAPLFEAQ